MIFHLTRYVILEKKTDKLIHILLIYHRGKLINEEININLQKYTEFKLRNMSYSNSEFYETNPKKFSTVENKIRFHHNPPTSVQTEFIAVHRENIYLKFV